MKEAQLPGMTFLCPRPGPPFLPVFFFLPRLRLLPKLDASGSVFNEDCVGGCVEKSGSVN